jgi:hypothetical protein
MAAKVLVHPVTGKTVRLGRNRPRARSPRLKLRNYLMRALAPPPASRDYTPASQAALAEMYMNDTLGDCVIAGIGHVVGVLTSNAGDPFLYTDDQIVALYSAIGGYDPSQTQPDGSNPTDNGCDEETALNYWQNNGAPAGSHQIAGSISIDPTNQEEIQTALYLFENLYFGIELPDAWINPFPSAAGFIWDVAGDPDPENGHCVIGACYDYTGVGIDSWGMLGMITYAAIAQYCAQSANGALYSVISEDSIALATAKAPTGFDWSQLTADFDSLGGNV